MLVIAISEIYNLSVLYLSNKSLNHRLIYLVTILWLKEMHLFYLVQI
jgi:hypothetical protein